MEKALGGTRATCHTSLGNTALHAVVVADAVVLYNCSCCCCSGVAAAVLVVVTVVGVVVGVTVAGVDVWCCCSFVCSQDATC